MSPDPSSPRAIYGQAHVSGQRSLLRAQFSDVPGSSIRVLGRTRQLV